MNDSSLRPVFNEVRLISSCDAAPSLFWHEFYWATATDESMEIPEKIEVMEEEWPFLERVADSALAYNKLEAGSATTPPTSSPATTALYVI